MKRVQLNSFFLLLLSGMLLITSCDDRDDEDISKDVKEVLTAAQGRGSNVYSNISHTVKDGVVSLDGRCTGNNCSDSALAMVKDVDGVKDVVNNIQQAAATTDLTLRTSVQSIISKYQGVQADVAEGVVVLRGTILRDQIQPLMSELSTLKADKIDNQLAIQ